ncbi:MAG: hypothetical protein ACP5I1_15190, partial [Candidatus Hinthialibacter sp.]
MNESMRALKAICWKQYRESRWIMLAVLILAICISYWPHLSFWRIFHFAMPAFQSHSGVFSIHDYRMFIKILGFLLAGFFFLPLLSIESERKTHALLAVKPISAEKCAFYKILAASIMALFLVWVSILAYLLYYHSILTRITNVQDHIDYPRLFLYFNRYALPIVFSFGSFFLFVSACANNRLRSFGAAFFILFAGNAIVVLSQFFITEWPPIFFFLQKILRLFLYGCEIAPTAAALTGCAIFIPLALAVFRIRLYHKLLHWQTYAAVSLFLLFLFASVFFINAPSRGLSLTRITPDSLGPEARRFADHLSAKRYAEEHNLNAEIIVQGPYIVSLEGKRGYFTQDQKNPQHLNLRIQKMIGEAAPQLLFDRTLPECFASHDESRLASLSQYEIFYRRDDWQIAAAQRSGIISGKITPGRIRYASPIPGYKEDGTPINKEPSPESANFFLGHFTLDDPVAFTPVKRCELHFIGKNGKETQTIECIQPGVFANADVDKIIAALSKEYFSTESNKTKNQSDGSLDELTWQNNAIGAIWAIERLQTSFLRRGPDSSSGFGQGILALDHYQQNRIFILSYLTGEAHR